MPKKVFLKPADGIKVYLPARGRNVFPEGELVAVDSFVERCMSEGALVEVAPAVHESAKKDTAVKKYKEDK